MSDHPIAKYALVLVLLSGCVDGTRLALREAEDMERRYAPACEKLGFKPGTEAFGDCLIRMSDRRR